MKCLLAILLTHVGIGSVSSFPAWARLPRFRRPAFISAGSGYQQVDTLNVDGKNRLCSTCKGASRKQLSGDKFNPIWSKDGKSLHASFTPTKGKIYLINPDGSLVREFSGPDGTVSDISLSGRVLFRSPVSFWENDKIFSANLDGTDLKRLSEARKSYQKSLELNPNNANAKETFRELGAKTK